MKLKKDVGLGAISIEIVIELWEWIRHLRRKLKDIPQEDLSPSLEEFQCLKIW